MNTKEFNAKRILYGDTVEALAEHLNLSRHTLSQKINGKSQFRIDEVALIVERYKLTSEETTKIFF